MSQLKIRHSRHRNNLSVRTLLCVSQKLRQWQLFGDLDHMLDFIITNVNNLQTTIFVEIIYYIDSVVCHVNIEGNCFFCQFLVVACRHHTISRWMNFSKNYTLKHSKVQTKKKFLSQLCSRFRFTIQYKNKCITEFRFCECDMLHKLLYQCVIFSVLF